MQRHGLRQKVLASADAALADSLKKVVGFRNVAIRDHQRLNLDIVRRIVAGHLSDFLAFAQVLLRPCIGTPSLGARPPRTFRL